MKQDYWSSLQLLSVAARALQRESAAHLKALGLPQLGYYILEYLDERSPMLQSELARLVRVRPQTIGAVLTTLETNQWITRQRGLPRNQIAVSITERGRALFEAARERLRALHLPADVEALRPILAAIINRTAHCPGS
ncbi:MarR family winged helix-turn-helix transcriptional regulator [Arthrobacter sp. NPDC092385]|uniref:MarR family winged helix-turn-helix transcriptional regulator n=1 Tax=Arthrobacter sp. NPDC092385 TaxID=3363943 RepID=UPI0038275D9A